MCLIPINRAPAAKNTHSWLIIFRISHWKPVQCFVAAMGFPPLADIGNLNTATNLFKVQRETYSCYEKNSGKPISAVSQLACCYQSFAAGTLLKWKSHIFWLKPLNRFFAIKRASSLLI
jgi:hypothetical protein